MLYPSSAGHQQFNPMYNQSRSQPMTYNNNTQFSSQQYPVNYSTSSTDYTSIIFNQSKTISTDELIPLLDKLTRQLKHTRSEQRLGKLNDIIYALIPVRPSILVSVAHHKLFIHIEAPFSEVIQQWSNKSKLNDDQSFLFQITPKLLKKIFKNSNETDFYPSWLFDSSFIEIIRDCLTNISKPNKYIIDNNQDETKNFIRLFTIYSDYQERLNEKEYSNQDVLIELMDPIMNCLSSQDYIDSFDITNINKKKIGQKEKFFLLKCPSFFLSYRGSRIDQIMNNLLSTMLPQYTNILRNIIPSINQWNNSTIRAVDYLLQIVDRGSTNIEYISSHLPFIDYILTIIDSQILYTNLDETLSNSETNLMNTAISFLSKIVNEPTILGYIKKKQVTPSFLRLTSAKYKPLQYNVYTLLSNITSENDIKSMPNPGALLSTTLNLLRATIHDKNEDPQQTEQLLETLKGLVQHDQMKEELLKQNGLPFLLDCAHDFIDVKLKLLLETLWSLSFSQDAAVALRSNTELIQRIENVSQTAHDEAMKKASEGLTWKLVKGTLK
ncbi:unnamed protein product [Rotaria sp. Silwood1]|nr:unnamed protein product [Rotaria sp. Silwood1]CAF5053784.1 unnamed protein product [Rotaria sp. Silwood1]